MAIQKSKVNSVDHKTGTVELESHGEDKGKVQSDLQLTQPYAGRGWGIRAGVETDSIVLVDGDKILGYQTDARFFPDGASEEDKEALKTEPSYKNLVEGEIVLQSKLNSLVFLDDRGNISLSTSDGNLLEVSKEADSINFLSVNSLIRTEASYIRNGLVKRDLRSEKEKENDLALSSLLIQDFSEQSTYDIVGANSTHKVSDANNPLVGVFDTEEKDPSILEIAGIKDVPGADKITSIANPALVEYRIDVNEFADGISSLNIAEDREQLKKGRLPPNLSSRFVLGTVVDENGRMPRFDYTFSSPKGHSEIWKLPGRNDKQISTDFRVDLGTSVKDPAPLNDQDQWISSGTDRFNTAQAFQLVLNTRGADNKGNIPNKANIGSRWTLQVDKEGLTKWNIPASTDLGGKESFRKGRSLLWNLEGSFTLSVGKEASPDLASITKASLLKTRKDRSYTVDYEGSVETRIGKDSLGQSQIIEADGGLRFLYGNLTATDAPFTKTTKVATLDPPSKGGRLVGTSISGKTEGGVDLALGSDGSSQSISLAAKGVIKIAAGSDSAKDSFTLNGTGSIKFKSGGGHKFEMLGDDSTGVFRGIMLQHGGLTKSVIQIDQTGTILLRNATFNAALTISATGAVALTTVAGKISLGIDGSVGIGGPLAGIDISPTTGVVLRTPGGSFSIDPIGKIAASTNTGFTVTGPYAHLNTTAALLSPGAASSPYAIAAAGPGFQESLTGVPFGGFTTIKG